MQKKIIFIIKYSVLFGSLSNLLWADNQFSIRLKQAPMVATLQQLALQQNINLIIDDNLSGSLSLQLQKTNLDKFLRSVAKSKRLELLKEDNIYYLTEKIYEPLRPTQESLGKSIILSEPELIQSSVKLHYAKASEVIKSLTTGTGSLLSSEGSISFDDRTNTLLIKDSKQSIKQFKKLVEDLDQPIQQVAIEARIVTMTDQSLRELGVRWGILDSSANNHAITGRLESTGITNLKDQLNINFATTTNPAGALALQIAKINGRLLDLELTALEQENAVEIIASPRLITTNKQSASIKQGTELPYVSVNEKSGSQSIEFREAVLGLDVTPHISKNNTILLDLVISQNAPGNSITYGLGEVVSIDKQEINTQVLAENGETIVLGGVFHDTITKGKDKVPVLGDILVIEHLFSKQNEQHQKRELVIFVTPRIVKKNTLIKQGQIVQKVSNILKK
ncbi:protein transport protein HofQ [Bisgaardia hudsonensis]|uniref:Protein transport protein HofQ n=1 Tax=Bisgaardia hudsonensis TaxID=109472 RepID=A0A4R2N0D3_9PAST|nr:type IV pilus secretin PilQ [Bisgaardia hudsonensis]QLB13420.1 secretin [Bisgaardia hudsonensis]TCP12825.1 protein transport protein HofQ [Bisgaardia hudsonensis]